MSGKSGKMSRMLNSPPPVVVARVVATALTGSGVAIAVVGTFLPWFVSGEVTRSSYEAVGLVEHFDLVGAAGPALAVWPAVPLLAAVCAAALITRFVRTATVACLVWSLLVGFTAVCTAARAGDHGPVGIDRTGPVVTAVGAGLAVVAALAAVVLAGRAARRPRPPAVAPAGGPPGHG